MTKKTTSIRLSDDARDTLGKYAQEQDMTRSEVIESVIIEEDLRPYSVKTHLDRIEGEMSEIKQLLGDILEDDS